MRYPIFDLFNHKLATLIYFITHRCNARCQMCFNYRNLNTGASQELSTSEIKSICHNLGSLILLQCTGGEPFLKEDLFEILNIFASKSTAIAIPTNACFPRRTEDIILRLVTKNKNTLFRVGISIDGLGDLHDEIRGYNGGFDLLLDTFYRLKKIQKKNRNLLLIANTVLTKMNEHAINDIIDFVYNLGVDDHTITYMWVNSAERQSLKPSLDSYKRSFKSIHSRSYFHKKTDFSVKTMRLINKLADIILIDILEKQEMFYHCKAIKKFVVMMPNGDILPCHLKEENLGNVRENNYNIYSILTNAKSTKLIKDIYNTRCWCTAQCSNRNNVIYNAKTGFYLMRYFSILQG